MTSRPIAIHRLERRKRDPPPWIRSVDAAAAAVEAPVLPEPVRAAAREAPCALLDGSAPGAISMARQLQTVDPALQLAIVAPAEAHARLRGSVMSHPGLGDVWVVTPDEVATELVERAGRLTRARRRHRASEPRDARDGLESANERLLRARSEFLATMSHEIRTPINAIIGYTDLLDMGIGGPVTDDQKGKLHRIKSSSQQLLALVDDVLDLAKVEAGRMTVEPGRAAAADAVAAALALVRPLAAQRGIEIVEEGGTEPPSYVGDEDRVRQVLVNLLGNAVKFSEEGSTVRVSYDEVSDPEAGDLRWTLVRVTDTGIGVAPEELERIFHAFEQVEHGHTRTRGGTGLGLTIGRRLARLMGGDLTVESEARRGSTFTLWLPGQPTTVGPIDGAVLAELLGPGALPRGLAAAGTALQNRVRRVLDALAQRIRHDPLIPMADALDEADVEDHASTFLADLGNTMIALERTRNAPERLLRDGGEIQRVIAELHGRQRARLGWTEDALLRELEIQQDEIRSAVIEGAPGETETEAVLEVLGRFLERAERITMDAWRRASAAPGGTRPRGIPRGADATG